MAHTRVELCIIPDMPSTKEEATSDVPDAVHEAPDAKKSWLRQFMPQNEDSNEKLEEDDAWDKAVGTLEVKEMVKTMTKNFTARGSIYDNSRRAVFDEPEHPPKEEPVVVIEPKPQAQQRPTSMQRLKSLKWRPVLLPILCTPLCVATSTAPMGGGHGHGSNNSDDQPHLVGVRQEERPTVIHERRSSKSSTSSEDAAEDAEEEDAEEDDARQSKTMMSSKQGETELRDPETLVSYTIAAVIGEGGFSKVYLVRAKDGHSGTRGAVYAAKIIPKSHLKMAGDSFVRATMLERNILGDVSHPFILKLYHAFQEKDRLVFIVDYCVGGSVHYHVNLCVRNFGRGLDETRAGFYVAEIALALSHLHKHGIVHRDLKLENVLVKRNGHVNICDFGTSKLLQPQRDAASDDVSKPPSSSSSSSSSSVHNHPQSSSSKSGAAAAAASQSSSQSSQSSSQSSHTKSIIGTPAYMSPEMLLEQAYNFSVDWWALGVALFTMLRAKLPFDGGRKNDEEKMLWRIVKSRPKYDPTWSDNMLLLVQSLLQKLPSTRICSLTELRAANFYRHMDWRALRDERLNPPFQPDISSASNLTYIPAKYAEQPVPARVDFSYKKGDSMRKLFKQFDHREAFDGPR